MSEERGNDDWWTRLATNATFRDAAQLYAEGRYWDAHEVWEALWRGAQHEPSRLLLQALIQVAAALYKVYEKGDVESAARLFLRAADKLESLPASLVDAPLVAFIESVTACRDVLEHDQDRGTLERARVPKLPFTFSSLREPTSLR